MTATGNLYFGLFNDLFFFGLDVNIKYKLKLRTHELKLMEKVIKNR